MFIAASFVVIEQELKAGMPDNDDIRSVPILSNEALNTAVESATVNGLGNDAAVYCGAGT
ncbi:hypothetical protein CTTA_5086 [Comamonas testosteroni]|uniref:Uncharacterized protein n=1 Tax=Comamonas testosteroni TaxID=285 RepID=A0A5A7MMM5_COMTE|nr:hypothetical protein CTTA_5086 [Comamonas testosteroni]